MSLKITKRAAESEKHAFDVNSLIYHRGNLYSAADDGKIMIWDLDLNKKGEVDAHPSTVYSLAAIEDTIYSCSNDGTIKAWTLDLKAKATLVQDDCEYWKLAAFGNLLFAGSDQGYIHIYEDNILKCQIEILEGIKDMVVQDKMLFSTKDIDVAITELLDGPKAHDVRRKTIQGRAPICLVDDKLVVTSTSAKTFAIHENSKKINYEMVTQVQDAHEMIINSLVGIKMDDNIYIYSAGWDRVLKKWKLNGKTLEMADTCLTGLVVNAMTLGESGQLFAAGGDGNMIRIDV